MHYQLFIPGTPGNPVGTGQQALERVGLADFIPGHESRQSVGPPDEQGNEQRGILIAWRKPGANERFHFNSEEQTWVPSVPNGPEGEGRGRYWVGFWNDSPIDPEDLRLTEADFGHPIQLGDGHNWILPTVQSFKRDIKRDPQTGDWHYPIQAKYHEAHFGAKLWWERLQGMTHSEVPWGEIAGYVESVLRLNYRLLPEVSDHLDLFNTDNITQALLAIIGAAGITEGEPDVE